MIAQRLALAIALLAGLSASPPSFAQDGWSLAKDADGIKVYIRSVDGSPLREFRGKVHLHASPADVVKVLRDADAFSRWMPDVIASKLLKATDTEQFHYLVNRAPWPVSNRDGCWRRPKFDSLKGQVPIQN